MSPVGAASFEHVRWTRVLLRWHYRFHTSQLSLIVVSTYAAEIVRDGVQHAGPEGQGEGDGEKTGRGVLDQR